MRPRRYALALALVLALAACGGGKSVGGGATSTTSGGSASNDACKGKTLQASEVGVTPTTITVTVMADTGSSIRPGLFAGSINAVKAWGDYMNANGGLACRQVVVKTWDSKLDPSEVKNGIASACGDSLAMVGTTALFEQDVSLLNSCKDKAGAPTGVPDLAELQTEASQQCSPVSFATLPTGASCPYSGTGLRTFKVASTQYDYYFKKYGKNTLHGVWTIPKDLNSTIAASMPIFRASQQMGIKLDAEFGASGFGTQPAYTPIVQAIKQHNSNYARNGLDYKGTVLERKEAQAQGVTSVKVWDCSVQCYDKRLITEGGSATEGQYVWLNILPLEDKGHNKELDTFFQYDKPPDGFGEQAWMAGDAFMKAVNDVVAKDGANGLTRKAVLDAIRNIHGFDAGGMAPKTDIGGRQGSNCLVGMQVQNGKFVRVDPTEPGKFDCSGTVTTLMIDPLKEFHG